MTVDHIKDITAAFERTAENGCRNQGKIAHVALAPDRKECLYDSTKFFKIS
jgi:hypothetical protein